MLMVVQDLGMYLQRHRVWGLGTRLPLEVLRVGSQDLQQDRGCGQLQVLPLEEACQHLLEETWGMRLRLLQVHQVQLVLEQ